MSQSYLPAPGTPIECAALRVAKAIETARAIDAKALTFVTLVECRRLDEPAADVLVFDVEVELAQRIVCDIRHYERIAVTFWADDSTPPDTVVLRPDFPRVPHLNLRLQELPRSLCLYDESYDEIKLRWTAKHFIERIRTWLALTAKGHLHADDQPLEPLLFVSPYLLVLPNDIFAETQSDVPELLSIQVVDGGAGQYTLIAQKYEQRADQRAQRQYVATALMSAPQEHGIIYQQPTNLLELHQFLMRAGVDLLAELRQRMRAWQGNPKYRDRLRAQLILIIALPKTRDGDGVVEAQDLSAFLCATSLLEIGQDIGLWKIQDDGHVATFIPPDEQMQGADTSLVLLNPTYALSPELAASCTGLSQPDETTIAAIGLGALGSQVFSNLVRMGIGRWTLIDKDQVAPHNLARHALYDFAIGASKAGMMATLANRLLNDEHIAASIVVDILHPGAAQADLERSLTEARVILDMAASVPVARHLALTILSPARRISLFLNPTGTDLVLLVEDAQRTIRLDSIEMQYYRHLLYDQMLAAHLNTPQGRLRYAQSCRDVSSSMPQDLVALHAALGSRAVRALLREDSAQITIWQYDPDTLSVRSVCVMPALTYEHQSNGWSICTDQQLLDKLAQARIEKLPNETGGVLVGTFDLQRKIVYVADTVLSPPDSTEWPTSYIRGTAGLTQRIEEIERVTAGMLGYVGEWHSHPRGYRCTPSTDDRTAFQWLKEYMDRDGLPTLMLIVGDQDEVAWYVNDIP